MYMCVVSVGITGMSLTSTSAQCVTYMYMSHALSLFHSHSRCLELDPGNLPAHMSLAVCYTNESRQIKVLTVPVCRLPALEAELHCCHSNSHRQFEVHR